MSASRANGSPDKLSAPEKSPRKGKAKAAGQPGTSPPNEDADAHEHSKVLNDQRLWAHIRASFDSKSCLRTKGLFAKLPWFTSTMHGDALLATSLRSANSRNAPELVAALAKLLDRYERYGIYAGLEEEKMLEDKVIKPEKERVMLVFRRLGFDPAEIGNDRHEMGSFKWEKTSAAKALKDYKIVFVCRLFDILAWASGAPGVSRAHALAKAPEPVLRATVRSAFGEKIASYLDDWTTAFNTTIKGIQSVAPWQEIWLKPPELLIDWTKLRITLPTEDQISSTLADNVPVGNIFGGSVFSTNIKIAAFGLCYIIKECFSQGDLSQLDPTKLQHKCSGKAQVSRGILHTLAVAMFISPLLLVSDMDLSEESESVQLTHMFEYWVQLGSADRPVALVRTELLIWEIVFAVAGGGNADAYLASFAAYCLSGPSSQQDLADTARWFVTGRPVQIASTSGRSEQPDRPKPSLKRAGAEPDTAGRTPKSQKTAHVPDSTTLASRPSNPSTARAITSNAVAGPSRQQVGPSPVDTIEDFDQDIDRMIERTQTLEESVRRKDTEILALRKAVQAEGEEIAGLRQAVQAKDAADSLELARGLELLNDADEQTGVKDLAGVVGALGKLIERLRAETGAAKAEAGAAKGEVVAAKTEADKHHRQAVETHRKMMEKDELVKKCEAQVEELGKQLHEHEKAKRRAREKINSSFPKGG